MISPRSLVEMRPGLWMLAVPMTLGPRNPKWSLCYLIQDAEGGLHIVDPGLESDENWQLLSQTIESLGGLDRVRSVVATHLHPDHVGLAGRLLSASGASLVMHEIEARVIADPSAPRTTDDVSAQLSEWGVPADRRDELLAVSQARNGPSAGIALMSDRTLADDEPLGIPGFDLVTMWTPGHTAGHISLRDESAGVVLTGDTVLPTRHPGIGLGGTTRTNPLVDYLASLTRLSRYDALEVLPGHGDPFRGLAARAAVSREHHLRRSREVRAVLAGAPDACAWQVAEQLTWTAGWSSLSGFYLYAALTQTGFHREFVEAGGLDEVSDN